MQATPTRHNHPRGPISHDAGNGGPGICSDHGEVYSLYVGIEARIPESATDPFATAKPFKNESHTHSGIRSRLVAVAICTALWLPFLTNHHASPDLLREREDGGAIDSGRNNKTQGARKRADIVAGLPRRPPTPKKSFGSSASPATARTTHPLAIEIARWSASDAKFAPQLNGRPRR